MVYSIVALFLSGAFSTFTMEEKSKVTINQDLASEHSTNDEVASPISLSDEIDYPILDETESNPRLLDEERSVEADVPTPEIVEDSEIELAMKTAFSTGSPVRWESGNRKGYAVPSDVEPSTGCRSVYYSEDNRPSWTSQPTTMCP